MDPASAGATAIVLLPLAASGARLIERVLGHGADEFGTYLTDKIKELAHRRGRVIERAAKALEAAEVEAQEVPIKILAPIIEKAGLEENEELANRWAALLANVAHPTRSSLVLPIFPHILSLLSPEDAVLLELIAERENNNLLSGHVTGSRPWVVEHDLAVTAGIPHDRTEVALSSLIGHNLIERQPPLDSVEEDGTTEGIVIPARERGLAVTPLGRSFLRACQFPEKRDRSA